ncbi:unnamed protein product [Pedinophyceae sp. YPF-701]|nr:unnamed protein product [Pedinophyceae sp. YPF-701]
MLDPRKEKERRLEEWRKKCEQAFLYFETKEGTNIIEQSDLGSVVRSLGLNPTEQQVDMILGRVKEVSRDPEAGFVHLDAFLKALPKMLLENPSQFVRDSYHKLMRAFRALDKDNNGYITSEQLVSALRSDDFGGTGLSDEEVDQALLAAADPEDGRIYYEDYAYLLAYDGREL